MRAVSEEVNFLEFLVRDVPQAERLVPSIREDIEGDLAANREGKAVVREFLPKYVHESLANTVYLERKSALSECLTRTPPVLCRRPQSHFALAFCLKVVILRCIHSI